MGHGFHGYVTSPEARTPGTWKFRHASDQVDVNGLVAVEATDSGSGKGALDQPSAGTAGWKIPWMEDLIARKIIDFYGPFSSQPCLITRGYPLVICYAIEHDAFIVDLPIEDGDFP